jgi:hypothetical protein
MSGHSVEKKAWKGKKDCFNQPKDSDRNWWFPITGEKVSTKAPRKQIPYLPFLALFEGREVHLYVVKTSGTARAFFVERDPSPLCR